MTPTTTLPVTRLVFDLPLPPNMANGRMHWRTKDRKRRAYFSECVVADYEQHGVAALATPTPMEKARIEITMRVARIHDHDNAVSRCKWAIDYLVNSGYLTDDSPKHLEWVAMPTQVIDRKNQGLRITLERCE